MYSLRIFRLLVAALSVVAVAQALQGGKYGPPVAVRSVLRRQDETGTGSTPKTTVTTPSQTPTSNPTTSQKPTTSNSPTTPTSQPPPPTTTSPPATTSARPTDTKTSQPPPTTDSPPSSTAPPTSRDSTATATDTAPPTTLEPSVATITAVVTTTNQEGVAVSYTTQSMTTTTPTLAAGSGGGATSGMTTQTRNTVIGVVVGVGGAIILGALALLAWRIRSRRQKAARDQHDGLVGYGGYTAGAAEKPEALNPAATGSMGGRTPFQSTLESYHNPTQVNKASNF